MTSLATTAATDGTRKTGESSLSSGSMDRTGPPAKLPTGPFATHAGSCLQSQSLLQGKSSVAIQHNGTVYRLQATKMGKLILTK